MRFSLFCFGVKRRFDLSTMFRLSALAIQINNKRVIGQENVFVANFSQFQNKQKVKSESVSSNSR